MFANLVLADEINRAAPKTQSALLEAMAEQHVTVGGKTYTLEEPFLVVATQNPIEQEGTYPLPEAQLDRFMMEIHIDYPTPAAGRGDRPEDDGRTPPMPEAAFDREAFLELRDLVRGVPVPQNVASLRGAAVRGQPAGGSARPDSSSRTTSPGAPARAARRTWCWPPRRGRCLRAARRRPSTTSAPSPCRSCATAS